MEFKDLVKSRRTELGITLEEIGKVVGVSKATVQRWETGEIKNIRRDKIAKLAEALQTSPAYLMGWDDEPAHDDDIDFAAELKKSKRQNDSFVMGFGGDGMTYIPVAEDEVDTVNAVLEALRKKKSK